VGALMMHHSMRYTYGTVSLEFSGKYRFMWVVYKSPDSFGDDHSE